MTVYFFLDILTRLLFWLYLVPIIFWWRGEIDGWGAFLGLVVVFILNQVFAFWLRGSNKRLLKEMAKSRADIEDKE